MVLTIIILDILFSHANVQPGLESHLLDFSASATSCGKLLCAKTLLFIGPGHHLFISPRSCITPQAEQTLSTALPCPAPYSTPRNFDCGPLLQKSVFFGGLGNIDCLPNSPRLFALLFAMHLLMAESIAVHGKRLQEDLSHVNKNHTLSPLCSVQPWGQKHPCNRMAKGKRVPKFSRTG